jgi:ribosomal-protein-alanine N-acetyltransferase
MLEININPFPVLETPRLKLRKVVEADVKEVFALRSDAEVMKFIPRPLAINLQDALDHIALIDKEQEANQLINWGITLQGSNKMIGMICLVRMQPENYRTEVGYILHPDYHGKGVMDEALKVVIAYAFDTMKFHSLEAVIDPANIASEKLLLRNLFVKEGYFKERTFYNGVFLDDMVYSRINRP